MTAASKPLSIEVVAYAPTAYFHCTHCEIVWQETGFSAGVRREQAATALPPDLLEDYQHLSDWVHELLAAYCDRVVVRVVDAASLEGVWKTLRFRLRKYPTVLVEGRPFEDFDSAKEAIRTEMTNA